MTDTSGTEAMITPELIRLDVSLGADKAEVIRALAGVVAEAGRTTDPDGLAADAMAREATSACHCSKVPAVPQRAANSGDAPSRITGSAAGPMVEPSGST